MVEASFLSYGLRCAAWWFWPAGPGPHPCVVMAHGFGGIRTAQLAGFADRFARAGVAALVFDYRHFGDSDGQPRDLVDIRVQRDDYRAAVAFARADQSLDSRRVAVWGTSFSSGHVLAVAAEDRNIAAAVLTNPYVDGPAALAKARGTISVPSQLKLLWAWLHDETNRMFQREPRRVDLTGPPGSVALFTTPDAQPGFASIMPTSTQPLKIPARIIGQIARDRPARHAARVRCPLLIAVCEHDRIAPVGAAQRVARAARLGELRSYPIEHFDVFTGPGFEQVSDDQTNFLRRVLLGATADTAGRGDRSNRSVDDPARER